MVFETNIICFGHTRHMMHMKKKAKFTGKMWRWGTWGNHRLRTPSTIHELLPPLRRSPSLEEGGLGATPVKAYGLAVD